MAETEVIETPASEVAPETPALGAGVEAKTEGASGEAKAAELTPKEIALPDGVELDADTLAMLKEADPQKRADAFLAQRTASETARAEQDKAAHAAEQAQWLADIRATYGDKLEASLQSANRAYEKFAPQSFKEFVKSSGLSNHPQMIALFHDLAKRDAEDTVAGTAASTAKSKNPEDALRALYHKSPKLFQE